jgi:hypothetical protein
MNVIHRTKADFHAGVDHAKNRPIETWYYNTANPRAASAGCRVSESGKTKRYAEFPLSNNATGERDSVPKDTKPKGLPLTFSPLSPPMAKR